LLLRACIRLAYSRAMSTLPRSAARFQEAATSSGLTIEVREMPDSTRTAEEAAAACGCTPAQIVKSLIFRGVDSGNPYLLLVSGQNRVDQKLARKLIGEKLDRPSADYVREATGYAIGGIPPLGHTQKLRTYMDQDLFAFDTVFAAAGTPRCIFAVAPDSLKSASGATVAALSGPE